MTSKAIPLGARPAHTTNSRTCFDHRYAACNSFGLRGPRQADSCFSAVTNPANEIPWSPLGDWTRPLAPASAALQLLKSEFGKPRAAAQARCLALVQGVTTELQTRYLAHRGVCFAVSQHSGDSSIRKSFSAGIGQHSYSSPVGMVQPLTHSIPTTLANSRSCQMRTAGISLPCSNSSSPGSFQGLDFSPMRCGRPARSRLLGIERPSSVVRILGNRWRWAQHG